MRIHLTFTLFADGIITLRDLEIYEVYDKEPVSITLQNGGYSVHSLVPPSSGVIHNYALNILDGKAPDF